uniref:F-box domain-containing protein n=1 Tax=Panagrellus redivivus TaxID=6233 RepID=A0A7E4ZZN0_PANRE
MPFPLHALDYGSRCRLRELATPGEAYYLQTAAPVFTGLKPIQTITHLSDKIVVVSINDKGEFCARRMPNSLALLSYPMKLNGNAPFCVTKTFRIMDFDIKHNAQLIFDNFVLEPEVISFVGGRLTSKFLHDVSVKVKTDVSTVDFLCTFDADVTFDFLCTLFKNMKRLQFSYDQTLHHRWIDTLIDSKLTNMIQIDISEASIDALYVDMFKLIEFMQAQTLSFYIVINLRDDCDDSIKKRAVFNLCGNRSFWLLQWLKGQMGSFRIPLKIDCD